MKCLDIERLIINFLIIVVVSVSIVFIVKFTIKDTIKYYTATKAGLEECPRFGAGRKGELIWVKSCKEYTNSVDVIVVPF